MMATSIPVSDSIVRMRNCRMTTRDARSMQRIIVKQGYLKKLPNGAKLGSLFKKPERRWFIFGVISHTYPYLEYYESEDCIFNGTPLNTIFLDACLYITRNQRTARYNNVFTVVLKDRKLSLIADSRDLMNEWCCAIEDKLRSLSIIDTVGGHNDYVSVPAATRYNRPSRSTTFSDRPPPTNELRSNSRSNSQLAIVHPVPLINESLPNVESAIYETLRQDSNTAGHAVVFENPYLIPAADAVMVNGGTSIDMPPLARHMFNETDNRMQQHYHSNVAADTSLVIGLSSTDIEQQLVQGRSRGAVTAYQNPSAIAVPGYAESYLLSGTIPSAMVSNYIEKSNVTNVSPPAYSSELVLELNANAPLKLRQVHDLKEEMSRSDGITLLIAKSHCLSALALVECFDRVWIAGWNVRGQPQLCSKFHIGDQVTAINGQTVFSARSANNILKTCEGRVDAELTVKRLPHATVIVVKKEGNCFDELGIETSNGTAEVSFVAPSGFAARSGFPCYASAIDGSDMLSNWWITEVNHQPLNLYYRNNEVNQRLNAAGSYLTFVAQPAPFIIELKRRLKTMKCFKDYLIE